MDPVTFNVDQTSGLLTIVDAAGSYTPSSGSGNLTNYYTKTQANNNFLSGNTSYYTQAQINVKLSGTTNVYFSNVYTPDVTIQAVDGLNIIGKDGLKYHINLSGGTATYTVY